ncbi:MULTISPECIES: sensor histidine kinase [Bifidobacterium]|uniref:sensor histidine kinase n=1 Tax=Bifidobacterium TaxID=1678 RepID=UPI001BDBE155|nr:MULTISPECIES: histidine kinase [Bifidobacterium]MBT1162304.1 sensor histidine kinase [Bifidobacterium sp. SO1]MBW3078844.1 sensor histidine kinase [Bifidobacterium simiiventris]
MVAGSMFMCLIQVSVMAQPQRDDPHGAIYVWYLFSTFAAFAFPFLLLRRGRHPEPTFWMCLAIVAVFPYDPLLMLMALTALVARRSDTMRTVRAVAAAVPVAVWAQVRDALQPADASFWHMLFAKPKTGVRGEPIVLLTGESTIIATAAVVAAISVAVATLIGLHIRSRARLTQADAQTQAAQHHVQHLQNDLDDQKLADAIAAEAHDTLAHSLSLIALNASALQAEANRLAASSSDADTADVDIASVAAKADEIRRQAAGALDEAHAIIDMLRHPQQAWDQLAPTDDTALTRESLDALIADARQAGAQVNTWIDIRQLGDLDESVGKVAYRAIQESLTNALRHAAGMPISLEVTVNPQTGVHVHASNPVVPASPRASIVSADFADARVDRPASSDPRIGSGLPGLTARVRSTGGACKYGVDERGMFHVDVTLPWTAVSPASGTSVGSGV